MAKRSLDQLTAKEEQLFQREFGKALDTLEREKLLRTFLLHALTQSEIVMITRRIQTAKLLVQGLSYREIEKNLRVGQRTIERVHRWLLEFREYRKQLPQTLEKKTTRNTFEHSFTWLRKKYPLHFLLINLILGDD